MEATFPLRRLLETDLCVTSLEIVLGAQISDLQHETSNEVFTSPRKGSTSNSVTEIVCLSLNDLHLKSMFRPFDTELSLTLGRLQCRDRMTSHPQAKYMIRSGSSDKAMIDLMIRNCSERSPMWQSVRSRVSLNVGDDVEISVNQSTLSFVLLVCIVEYNEKSDTKQVHSYCSCLRFRQAPTRVRFTVRRILRMTHRCHLRFVWTNP